jgi:hypothetical protein
MIRGLGEDEEMKEEIYERSEAIAATNIEDQHVS